MWHVKTSLCSVLVGYFCHASPQIFANKFLAGDTEYSCARSTSGNASTTR